MGISPGLAAFKLTFQLSPIMLTGGIATLIPGGLMPIISVTQALTFTTGLLSGGSDLTDLDDFFANFQPLPGGTLIDQELGKYPFANQQVAANAVIAQPLTISYRMICPARGDAGYAVKLATMLALQATLKQHNSLGGTYVCATPSFFYTNCVMRRMVDVSTAESLQAQNTWQLDFERPLLTIEDAIQAQSGLMSQITAGTPINGTPSTSGFASTVNLPSTVAAPSVVPAAASPAGSGTVTPDSSFSGPF